MILRALDVARLAAKLIALGCALTGRYPFAIAAWMVAELLIEAWWFVDELEDENDGNGEGSEEPPRASSRPHPRHRRTG